MITKLVCFLSSFEIYGNISNIVHCDVTNRNRHSFYPFPTMILFQEKVSIHKKMDRIIKKVIFPIK